MNIFLVPFYIAYNLFCFFILNKYFFFFLVIWSILSYFLVKKIFQSVEKYKNAPKEVQEKYPDFIRRDWANWNFTKIYIGAIFFSWIKLLGVLFVIVSIWLHFKIITRGKDIYNVTDKTFKDKVKSVAAFWARLFLVFTGIIVNNLEVDADYSKYLGKDYLKEVENKKAKEKYCCIISNHVSWVDILIMMSFNGSGFITSNAVKSFPFIGTVCTLLGSIYIDRASKENRNEILNQVSKKLQAINDEKDLSNICIFAEGTTSNGSCFLPFKKGAFGNLLPVKPMVIKIETKEKVSLAMDIIEMVSHLIIVCCIPLHFIDLQQFPVFTPNEYFIKEYIPKNKPEGKSDWYVYSEVVREIMSQHSGIKKGKQYYEDKVELLGILRGKKNQ